MAAKDAEQHPHPRVTMLAKETQASRRGALSRRERVSASVALVGAGTFQVKRFLQEIAIP